MTEQTIRFGVIGCGLMAREFASAVQRWAHVTALDVRPRLVAIADAKESCLCWFTDNLCDVTTAVTDYRELLVESRCRRGLLRGAAPPAHADLRRHYPRRQAPAGREAVRHRPGS